MTFFSVILNGHRILGSKHYKKSSLERKLMDSGGLELKSGILKRIVYSSQGQLRQCTPSNMKNFYQCISLTLEDIIDRLRIDSSVVKQGTWVTVFTLSV